ncbi:hypothetical protein G7B40_029570 [Aetokthonos hydrillicola Thurmond2011]|jgi:ribosomal protein L37AE/L43A|uniref:Uncharacterized protein n=1 Tax=Aetokthonos hydrillicola Thurmond2011 TaxID=2712845 RepID=A0AAP5IBX3_9CYAN|nr:hypothetical protein [Aetokthonos hydrillicola]MBO3462521.1 hypothetical protein [Aetokthonos hydrillicola CCALA 1050]MBW4591306.1 hypothetical protein [Aetokthonos hydrillicola CCALA 1050]MDR9898676.1 hypothetical protein [Aetokthonos hydrillicola Thurmond2011]
MSMIVNNCPCCGGSLLRHVRHSEFYWLCQNCRQEVPLLTVTRIPTIEGRNKGVIAQQAVNS